MQLIKNVYNKQCIIYRVFMILEQINPNLLTLAKNPNTVLYDIYEKDQLYLSNKF